MNTLRKKGIFLPVHQVIKWPIWEIPTFGYWRKCCHTLYIDMKKLTLSLASIFVFLLWANAQTIEQRIVAASDSFRTLYPMEKVFLHTDKSNYSYEETIWFKAYTTIDERLSILSSVLYIDLLNERGDIVEKRMLPLKKGTANGNIFLPNTLTSGNYTLRAYTLWMLNFKDYVFRKPLYIFGNDFTLKAPAADMTTRYAVQLFPEGGNLVEGVPSQVAFKATGQNGLPVAVTGSLIDEAGQSIATLSTSHDGMGQFEITPQVGKKYKARFRSGNGSQVVVDLPKPLPEGIVMTVNNNGAQKTFVALNRSEKNKALYNNLIISAQMAGQVVYTGKVNFDEDQNVAAINKKNLPPGIMQVTVFDNNGIPLAERLVFVHTVATDATLNASANTKAYGKNEFRISTTGFNMLNASAAIIDADAEPGTCNNTGILASLLLNGELKGYIHQPDYYFSNNNDSVHHQLDLLLMTQGWRKFNWEALLKMQFPPLQYAVESGISIAGKLLKADGKSPLQNGRTDIIIKTEDSLTIVATAITDARGIFVIDSLSFKNEAKLYVQGTNRRKEDALTQLELFPAYYDTLLNTRLRPFADLDPNTATDHNSFSGYAQQLLLKKLNGEGNPNYKSLQEVRVRARRKSSTPIDSLNQRYATDLFYLSDQTIPMDEKGYYVDIWPFLQRNIAGLEVGRNNYGQTTANFSRFSGLDMFSENPSADSTTNITFFLNEIQVTKDVIDFLNPSDVAMVKVWKGPSATVFNAPRGVIGIYTKKDARTRDFRDRGFDNYKKKGYSDIREFYSPVYTTSPPADTKDERITLQWIPNLKIDGSGNAIISFYNNAITKRFRLVVQGIDANGKMLQLDKIVE